MNRSKLRMPDRGFEGLKSHWKADIFAGIWVGIISLPLSIGIALASGFPAISGITSALIGGIVLTFLSSSYLTIKGPGISMIAIVLIAVENLSQYPSTGIQYTLAVIVMAGVIQVFLGVLRIGLWHSIVPYSIVYGVITAVGIMVVLRQTYYLIGLVPDESNFFWLFIKIPLHISTSYPSLTSLGIISLALLIILDIPKLNLGRVLPGVFLVFDIGLIWGYTSQGTSDLSLIAFPESLALDNIYIQPLYTKIFTQKSLEYAFALALLSTLESIINAKSTEVLDLHRRRSKIDLDIVVLGLGNVASGLLGGLPLIITLEKSTINVNQGAKTRWAGFFQSFFVLLMVFLAFPIFHYIPMATMAAIVIFLTYRHNSPKLFKNIQEIGTDQFFLFLVSIFLTLTLGILYGILAGVVLTVIVYIFLGGPIKSLFFPKVTVSQKGKRKNKLRLDIHGAAVSSNYFVIKRHLDRVNIEDHARLIIDLSATKVVDYTFLELIYRYAALKDMNDGRLELQGLKNHKSLSKHPLSTLIKSRSSSTNNHNPLASQMLNERQLDIQAIASVNNATLEPNLTYDGVVLQDFPFAFGYEIRYRENKFMKFYRNNTIEFSDVFLSKGIRMSEQSHEISVMLITVMDMPVPNFSLSHEDFVDKMLQKLGYEDIDFEDYPEFSENYVLTGESVREIRKFFSHALIVFLEENPGYYVEAQENKILIYQDVDLLNKTKIEDTLEFAENFLDLMRSHEIIESEEVKPTP